MSELNFEVHIGTSQTIDKPRITRIPTYWKRDPVIELVSLKEAHEYEEHNVEGKLRTLLTKHASNIHEIQALVDEASSYCRNDPSSRVEIEQVLVSCDRDLNIGHVEAFPFTPTREAFPSISMISATPPYEVHYCLAWSQPEDMPTIEEVAAVCSDANINIDELVHFGGDEKITTTKFYRRLDHMIAELESDARLFLAALDRSLLKVRFRLIAERIITCGIPVFAK